MPTIMYSRLEPGLSRALGALPHRGKVCHLLAAVSGGADSTALLYALAQLRSRDGFLLSCVHVEHGLRGEASREDAAFVRSLCQRWDIPFYLQQPQGLFPGMAGLESQAREARYQAFRTVYRQTGADALLLAHHRGDQAETVLMHLMRGSGLKGLCGISPDSCRQGMRILRPFLDIPPELLRKALLEVGQPWREDATNRQPDNLRNALRLDVMPRLEALAPGCGARIAQVTRRLAEAEDYLASSARPLLSQPGLIPLKELADAHPAIQKQALRSLCPQPLSDEQTQALQALALGPTGRSMDLTAGLRAYRGSRYLHLLPPPPRDYLQSIAQGPLPPGQPPGDGVTRQALPLRLTQEAVFRTRRPGDRITPFGGPGSRSLQDYLTDRKIDQPFRSVMPLLAVGGEILWIPGVGASQACRLAPGEKAWLYRLTAPLPWQGSDQKNKGAQP